MYQVHGGGIAGGFKGMSLGGPWGAVLLGGAASGAGLSCK